MDVYQKKYDHYIKTANLYKIRKYDYKLYGIKQVGGAKNGFNILYQKKIIGFIKQKFDNYLFERMREYNEDSGFNNYNKFIKHNEKCVRKLSDIDLEFIDRLIDKIREEEIVQCDEDNFVEWETYSIYFNKNKKLVMMHPR